MKREEEAVFELSPLVSCFWCEQLHAGQYPLSVCSACASRYATLRSLEMSGSFPLTYESIDDELTTVSPGNYALGYLDGEDFNVFYVGRSDSDLRRRLHQWVGTASQFDRYASTAKASWGLRCRARYPVDAPALDRVGNAESAYTHFAYSYAVSAEDAYAREWRNYDSFGGCHGLDNKTEPAAAEA
jgi:hypothetical protein